MRLGGERVRKKKGSPWGKRFNELEGWRGDDFLQHWVEEISLQDFQKPFLHKVRYNPRLRTTGGRYLLKDHSIEINPKQYEVNGRDEVLRIIRHELCHYHLHLEGKGFRHRDRDFKELLAKVGGTRFCQRIDKRKSPWPIRYLFRCLGCGMEYPRKRRMNPAFYRCGKCGGGLTLIPLSFKKEYNGMRGRKGM
ncbi:Protein SprT-like [[Clostridium] ultunense Esp]|nr:Protein SprT-like [[Clostridium] ultunense Esp]